MIAFLGFMVLTLVVLQALVMLLGPFFVGYLDFGAFIAGLSGMLVCWGSVTRSIGKRQKQIIVLCILTATVGIGWSTYSSAPSTFGLWMYACYLISMLFLLGISLLEVPTNKGENSSDSVDA